MRPNPAVLSTLGQSVRHHRDRLGVSQEALADLCGLDRTYVGGIERGERNVTIGTILQLAGALGVTVSVLLEPLDQFAGGNADDG